MNRDLLEFWGKARPESVDGPRMHPLLFHLLDVAAAAEALLAESPGLERRLILALGLDPASARAALTLLAGLHDLGKFSRPFQSLAPELWPVNALGPTGFAVGPHHTCIAWLAWLADEWPTIKELFADHYAAEWIMRAVFGHHGRPPEEELAGRGAEAFGEKALTAAGGAVTLVKKLLAPGIEVISLGGEEQAQRASWLLAGFIALADWVGSNGEFFPYTDPAVFDSNPGRYFREHAQWQARDAVAAFGLKEVPVASFASREAILHRAIGNFEPTPLQRWAMTADLPPAPALFILEDATGAGKTEAALILAARLMAAGRAGGLAIGLPTQATANAMFERMGGVYRGLFAEDGPNPSIALAHGDASLHEGFREAVTAAERTGVDADEIADGAGQTASATCTAWLADDRRRAFLADVTAGTVDQMILGVLPSKHQAMRLLGLSGKVLVIDEAHAYDAYVGEELGALLRFHAALDGDAILHSATLPAAAKEKLAAGWARRVRSLQDRQHLCAAIREDAPYPLTTVFSADGTHLLEHIEARDLTVRSLPIERLDSSDAAVEAVVAAVQDGAAVAWIRNAVDDVIEAAKVLGERGLEPLIFHARFAYGDRLAIEQKAKALFGTKSKPDERRGKVIVASQVIEQSLDLDFDLMVSDLAPADLLIQRAGRLARHKREGRPVTPRLLIVSPEPPDAPDAGWLGSTAGRTRYVYKDEALLWRSARALFRRGELKAPEAIRPIIEEAYGRDWSDRTPEGLQASAARVEGDGKAMMSVAAYSVLDPNGGYCATGPWLDEARVQTRAGAMRVPLRLGRLTAGRIVPWAAKASETRSLRMLWRLSEVAVRPDQARGEANDPVLTETVAAAKEGWGKFEKDWPLVVLGGSAGDRWVGCVTDVKNERKLVEYSSLYGLTFSKF